MLIEDVLSVALLQLLWLCSMHFDLELTRWSVLLEGWPVWSREDVACSQEEARQTVLFASHRKQEVCKSLNMNIQAAADMQE